MKKHVTLNTDGIDPDEAVRIVARGRAGEEVRDQLGNILAVLTVLVLCMFVFAQLFLKH
jgi:hypothetical protein